MKTKIILLLTVVFGIITLNTLTTTQANYHPEFNKLPTASFGIISAQAYPPGVGILTNSTSCLSCHENNGPWKDDANTIIDILDKDTKLSLKQTDGTFLIEVKKGEQKTVLTVIGSRINNSIPASYRNAWLYIDPATIGKSSLSKFAPNWDVNLPMSCRLVGDNLKGYEDASITSLPMTIQPLEHAMDAELSLQVMLTKGESIKGSSKEGMSGSYFERKVKLKIK
ncbi:MAG: hypothetical protein Q8M15_17150 [Bacteroidota bacterium]|nr:hypothetical protein [Bacteroidota bacterium]